MSDGSRTATRMRDDVPDGFVPRESADAHYGVMLAGGEVDAAATHARRAELARAPTGTFHRDGGLDGVFDAGPAAREAADRCP